MSARIEGIDVLRGLAALGVASFHIYSQNSDDEFRHAMPDTLNLIAIWGRYGVQVFFVISGFVVGLSLYNRANFCRFVDFPSYFLQRMVRLDPLYWACLAAYVLFVPFLARVCHTGEGACFPHAFGWGEVLKNVFYFLPLDQVLWMPIAWTLAIEVQFYLFMSALIIASNRYLNTAYRDIVIYATCFASLAVPFGLVQAPVGSWLFGNLYQLCAGLVIFLFFKEPTRGRALLCALYVAFLLVAALIHKDSYTFATVLSALIILGAVPLRLPDSWVRRLLLKLGAASYAMYMLHQLVGIGIGDTLRASGLFNGVLGIIPVCLALVASVALAYGAHLLIERPSLKLSRSAFKGRGRPLDRSVAVGGTLHFE